LFDLKKKKKSNLSYQIHTLGFMWGDLLETCGTISFSAYNDKNEISTLNTIQTLQTPTKLSYNETWNYLLQNKHLFFLFQSLRLNHDADLHYYN